MSSIDFASSKHSFLNDVGFGPPLLSTDPADAGLSWGASEIATSSPWSPPASSLWGDGFASQASIDPWYVPSSVFGGLDDLPTLESTILIFDEPTPIADTFDGIFDDFGDIGWEAMSEHPNNIDLGTFDWLSSDVAATGPTLGLPDDGRGSAPTWASWSNDAGLTPSSHPAATDAVFDLVGLGQKVATGVAKGLSESGTHAREAIATKAGSIAKQLTGHEADFAKLIGDLAGDPNISDEVFESAQNAYFEARAFAQQSRAVASEALDDAGRSAFFGTLTGGTVDALAGTDRLLDADRKIRDAATPQEAYRTMWETAVRFPLDVALAAPNRLGLVKNIGLDYAADAFAGNVADLATESTFESFFENGNRFAHYLHDNGYLPNGWTPKHPLN